ncbi:MAG: GHKL domain-containing protein, partial [Planctomycetes bacterium]|nr:GHKL domain-containing protein [Planctomycetota bacterium]
ELLPNGALREPIAAAWSAQRTASSVDFEHQHRHLRARIVRAGDDVVVLVLHDLTEIKRLEAARRDFMAAVSHEFKTPLTSILGFTETLLAEGVLADPANARTFVERIGRHADRLASLVKDVLTLSRLEQGAWPLRPVACDLIDVANEVVAEFAAVAETATVSLTLDAPRSVPLRTDPELVRQLVGNLVSNAIRYNRAQGSVYIRVAARADGQAVIIVADTGIGIPSEHRERIFERFYRIDSHRSRQTGGTGLGLAIVKHLLQVLDGTVMLHSAADGTRFEVYLRDLSDSDVAGKTAAGT